jgi:CRP-like cAMP-binding protein
MDSLLNRLNSIEHLTEADRLYIKSHLKIVKVKKGSIYIELNQICKKIGYVSEGVFRVVNIAENGKEITEFFFNENHFAVELESFSNATPSVKYIEALTDCSVIEISIETFQHFEKTIPVFAKITNKLKEIALIEQYRIKSEMLTDDAATRYSKLMQRNPTIIQRIPQSYIASFLGISQYTLSRIKADNLLFGKN